MLSDSLIHDAAETSKTLDALSSDTPADEYFRKGSLALIPSPDNAALSDDDDVALLRACKPLLDVLHNGPQTYALAPVDEDAVVVADWTRFNTCDNSYSLIVAQADGVKLGCVPHSQLRRDEWMSVDVESLRGEAAQRAQLVEMELERGQILFIAHSMPWILKEGLVRCYTLTVKFHNLTESTKKPMKPKTYEECVAKLASLKERVAKLDKRLWNPNGTNAKAIKEFEGMPVDQVDKRKIDNVVKSLGKMEANIHAAENDKTLPVLLAELEEVRVHLDTKMGHVLKATQKKCRKRYDDLVGAEYNLVGRAKTVHDLLAEVKALADGTAVPASTTPKIRTDVTRESTATVLASAASAASAAACAAAGVITIPEIDPGTLTPYVIDHADGPDGYIAVVQNVQKTHRNNFATMVQALKHEGVSALHQKWTEEGSKVQQQVQAARRDPSLGVNVTLYMAYADALKKLYEDTKGTVVAASATAAASFVAPAPAASAAALNAKVVAPSGGNKTTKCGECDNRRKEFDGSGLCRECYNEIHIKPRIEKLEDRTDLLARQANREEDEAGPLHVLHEEFLPINEKLAKAYQAFERPNPPASAWEKLKELMKQADDMLPGKKLRPIKLGGGEEEEEEDEEEEDFDSDDADGIVLHSDEESSSSSSSSPKHKKRSRKDELSSSDDDDKDDNLAHQALETMYRLPVASVHESILENYHNKRYVLVQEEVKRLEEVKEVYGFTVQAIRKDEEDEPEEWHTYFLKRNDAVKLANSTAVPDKIRTKVITKRVAPDESPAVPPAGGGGDEESPEKKVKKTENDDE